MKRRAFTFIELMVVIAIICVLATILFPVFHRAQELGKAQEMKKDSPVPVEKAPEILNSGDVITFHSEDGTIKMTIKVLDSETLKVISVEKY